MNVFNKVTLASLKKNRTRTVVTIIGIMLSAAMICASTTFVASMQNFVLRYTIYKTGDWHGAVYDAAYKDYEDIGGSGKVASATYAQVLGYESLPMGTDCCDGIRNICEGTVKLMEKMRSVAETTNF